ncbi:helix-turn-helix transcriptional regulator [Clostridium botulinum]|uniref:helix-turn-helix transcriptional regulator n=1 Tax=Clostridium botulinum TaxID=1491 RepID=UPI0004D6AF90|nr:helix-turn-helix transcriptional regulator [Clostridium botulinum]KEH96134.1 transcriptional regulator [Clostridium botulinum D str. 16868]
MELKDKVKKYRKENGLTQKQLSELLGVSRTNVAEIENGRIKGTVKFITKMAEISKTPIAYWSGEEIENNYKTYEALDVLIEAMLDSEMIKNDGKINESAQKLIIAVLEKEVKYKIQKRKEEQD